MLVCAAASCSGSFSQSYTVQKGDTLNKIAISCSVPLQHLESANTQFEANFNLIHPGDTVCVPSSCSPSGRKLLHSKQLQSPCSTENLDSFADNTITMGNDQAPCYDLQQASECEVMSGVELEDAIQNPSASSILQGSRHALSMIAQACNVSLSSLQAANKELQNSSSSNSRLMVSKICVPAQCTALLHSIGIAAAADAQSSPNKADEVGLSAMQEEVKTRQALSTLTVQGTTRPSPTLKAPKTQKLLDSGRQTASILPNRKLTGEACHACVALMLTVVEEANAHDALAPLCVSFCVCCGCSVLHHSCRHVLNPGSTFCL